MPTQSTGRLTSVTEGAVCNVGGYWEGGDGPRQSRPTLGPLKPALCLPENAGGAGTATFPWRPGSSPRAP